MATLKQRIRKAALRRLNSLEVKPRENEDTYDRRRFGSGWQDVDRDGEDTRAEVLIRFHRPGIQKAELVIYGGTVRRGRWHCRFTGQWFTDASDLDIDHHVPLWEAWVSGAHAWTDDRRERYANGVGIRSHRRGWLLPVSASANRSKGRRGPADWKPSRESFHLKYAAWWIKAKKYWGMSVDAAEKAALLEMLSPHEDE